MKWLLVIIAYLIGSEIIAALIRSRRVWMSVVFKSNGCNMVPEGNWPEC